MRILVLGAGVIGVTSAWYLAGAGHEVTVLDRQPEPGLETSFANGGQISVSHSAPWASPGAPLKILRWLGREDAPLLFRARADFQQWLWGARFLLNCLPERTRRNTEAAFALALHSRDSLRALRAETGIAYDQLSRGILSIYTDPKLLDQAESEVSLLRAHGFDLAMTSREECLAIEPALAGTRVKIHGGSFAHSDETGDAHLFTQRLAALAEAKGVKFEFDTTIERIEIESRKVARVRALGADGIARAHVADRYVVALGSYSPRFLAPIGVRIPVYPVKGYSITMPVEATNQAPVVSISDQERKIVITRLGDRLRVAGTAELNGYNTELNTARIRALVARVGEIFPRGAQTGKAIGWTGLRPATPSNLPLIGRSRIPNLYLNTGHGTLGWTMACGSGRSLAELIDGKRPEPDFPFLDNDR